MIKISIVKFILSYFSNYSDFMHQLCLKLRRASLDSSYSTQNNLIELSCSNVCVGHPVFFIIIRIDSV